MANIRDTARAILDNAVPPGAVFRSNDPPIVNNTFERLTNTPHATMLAKWLTGGIMTACNGFVGWYANQLKIEGILDWFSLKKSLETIKRSDAWVQTAWNRKPKYGDILKHAILHVDVALDFNDNQILTRVAAGQGDGTVNSTHDTKKPLAQRAFEYDVLCRVPGTRAYDFLKLEGWLDIQIFMGESYKTPVPDWLFGWWETAWRGEPYYYFFDTDHTVKWTQVSPFTAFAPINVSGMGTFTSEPLLVTITWDATGSVEKWVPQPLAGYQSMTGSYNDTDMLVAQKM